MTNAKNPVAEIGWLLLCITVAICLQQYAVFCHIGITYDSLQYTAAAKSFATSGQLLDAKGRIYTAWPPLYPVLLSVAPGWVEKAGAALNAVSLAGIVWLTFVLCRLVISWGALRMVFLLVLSVGTPLLLVGTFLWSETVFIFLLLAAMVCLQNYSPAKSRYALAFLILLSNLMCLQRNTGIFFVLAIILLIGWREYRTGRLLKGIFPVHMLVYTLLSPMAFLLWWWRNEQLGQGSEAVAEYFAVMSFGEELYYYTDIFTLWFLPGVVPWLWRLVLVTGAIAGLIFLIVRMKKKIHSLSLSLWLLNGVYLLIMVLLRKDVRVDSERYLAPVYPLVLLLLFSGIDFITRGFHKFRKTIIIAAILLWMSYPVARTLKNVRFWHRENCKGQLQP